MQPSFNLTKLEMLLKDFYTVSRIRLTVYDDSFRELVAYPPDIAPVCRVIRTDPKAHLNCLMCDRKACETASLRHSAYTYRCHAGLTESIVPIYLDHVLIGYLFFGHVLAYETYNESIHALTHACAAYDLDFNTLKEAVFKQPLISEDYIASAAEIMRAVASYLCLERMAVLRYDDLPSRIDQYINAHYTEDLRADTLCDHFLIGRTKLYEIAKESYGCGIAAHIRTLRIEKAKKMLTEQPSVSISEVARACGYDDYNYFITVFRRETGLPPRQYARGV